MWPTLGSASEVSLACYKILSNRSSRDFGHLPARDKGDRAMKHPSSELCMRGILGAPLVLFACAGVHVGRWNCRADRRALFVFALAATAAGLMERSWRVGMFVRLKSAWCTLLEVDHSAVWRCCCKMWACFDSRMEHLVIGKNIHLSD